MMVACKSFGWLWTQHVELMDLRRSCIDCGAVRSITMISLSSKAGIYLCTHKHYIPETLSNSVNYAPLIIFAFNGLSETIRRICAIGAASSHMLNRDQSVDVTYTIAKVFITPNATSSKWHFFSNTPKLNV